MLRDSELARLQDLVAEQHRTIHALMAGSDGSATPVVRRLAAQELEIARLKHFLEAIRDGQLEAQDAAQHAAAALALSVTAAEAMARDDFAPHDMRILRAALALYSRTATDLDARARAYAMWQVLRMEAHDHFRERTKKV